MTGQPPETSEQSSVISAAAGHAVNDRFGCDASLQHPAPASKIFKGHANALWNAEFSCSAAAQTCLKAGQGAHHHPLDRKLLVLSNQEMAGFMHGDSSQPRLSTGERLSQNVTTHALPAGCIDT